MKMRPQKPPKIRSYNCVSKIVMIHQSERNIIETLLTVNSLSGKLFNFFPQRQYIFTVEQETTKKSQQQKLPGNNHFYNFYSWVHRLYTFSFICLASYSINCFVYCCFNFGCVVMQHVYIELFLMALNIFQQQF